MKQTDGSSHSFEESQKHYFAGGVVAAVGAAGGTW